MFFNDPKEGWKVFLLANFDEYYVSPVIKKERRLQDTNVPVTEDPTDHVLSVIHT